MNRTIEQEAAAIEIMKLQAEAAQLRAQNKWLREANKGLWEMLNSHGIYIPGQPHD